MTEKRLVFSVLCYADDIPVGLVNCCEAFSNFECRPLVNIHDVIVALPRRREGIRRIMLQRVEQLAAEEGCCKLTLEVLAGNTTAQQAYQHSASARTSSTRLRARRSSGTIPSPAVNWPGQNPDKMHATGDWDIGMADGCARL